MCVRVRWHSSPQPTPASVPGLLYQRHPSGVLTSGFLLPERVSCKRPVESYSHLPLSVPSGCYLPETLQSLPFLVDSLHSASSLLNLLLSNERDDVEEESDKKIIKWKVKMKK